jgi:pentatricopeptide repeat protein
MLWRPEQAYSALLHAAVKCGETDLAVDVYEQMGRESMPRDRSIYVTMIEMFVKLGRVSDALAALAELHKLGEAPDTHLYNLVLVAATKAGPPRFVLTVYHRWAPRLVTDKPQAGRRKPPLSACPAHAQQAALFSCVVHRAHQGTVPPSSSLD